MDLFHNDIDPWRQDDSVQKTTAQIVFSQPPFGPYTYLIPEKFLDNVEPGMRVRVPLGGRHGVVGWVVEVAQQTEKANAAANSATNANLKPDLKPDLKTGPNRGSKMGPKLRPIESLVDDAPLLDSSLLDLTRWIADYYLCPWGQALETSVPAGVKYQAGTRLTLFLEPTELVKPVLKEADQRFKLEAKLKTKGSPVNVSANSPGAVPVDSPEYSAPTITRVQQRVLLAAVAATGPLTMGDLASRAGCSFGPINELRTKGLLHAFKKRVQQEPQPVQAPQTEPSLNLNLQQQCALKTIIKSLHSKQTETILLHGVTGSGKTEVYIQAISEALRFGRQAIVLVPEISLTPQTAQRFKSRFPRVAVLHSHLTDVERNFQWTLIARGEIDVVVGARSAIFAPLRRLGLIIIDEEHENTFKQETAPRYHAREVAQYRAKLKNIPLVLGTATPSLESWRRVQTGEYRLISMPHRVNNRPLPFVGVVDMCDSSISQAQRGVVTRKLHMAITAALRDKRQVILLLNRRGFNTQIQCPACGEAVKCPSCDIALTYHRDNATALCHYCDYEIPVPDKCPNCGFPGIKFFGFGTQRLESEIRSRFPQAVVCRMDTDTMQAVGAHEKVLSAFRRGEIDILLGTQMIAKGLDFPNVTVVGVINADTALHLPDFRAGEKTFQLITQVAGRTGRGEWGGQVIVQTYQTENPAIVAASHHDFLTFVKEEAPLREAMGYPPYTFMARIILRAEDEALASREASRLRDVLDESFGLEPSIYLKPKSEPTLIPAPASIPAPSPAVRDDRKDQQLSLFDDPIAQPKPSPALIIPKSKILPPKTPTPKIPVPTTTDGQRVFTRILGPAPAPIYKLRDFFRFQIQINCADREYLAAVLKSVQQDFAAAETVQWIIDMDPVSML